MAARTARRGGRIGIFFDRDLARARQAEHFARRPHHAQPALPCARHFHFCARPPQLGKSLTEVEASGIDIMVVLDVSGSMLTKDFTVGGDSATRIDAIREVTRKFIEAGLTIGSESSPSPAGPMSLVR